MLLSYRETNAAAAAAVEDHQHDHQKLVIHRLCLVVLVPCFFAETGADGKNGTVPGTADRVRGSLQFSKRAW